MIEYFSPLSDAQVRWACRRGMLELDLIFERYYDHHLSRASLQERHSFEALLCEQDQDLYTWLVKRETPPEKFLEIIRVLLASAG
jgi:antitoxin CptB